MNLIGWIFVGFVALLCGTAIVYNIGILLKKRFGIRYRIVEIPWINKPNRYENEPEFQYAVEHYDTDIDGISSWEIVEGTKSFNVLDAQKKLDEYLDKKKWIEHHKVIADLKTTLRIK